MLALNGAVFLAQQVVADLTSRYVLFRPLVAAGQWYRLVTSTLLHANLVHLLFNSLALWWYARPVEQRLGTLRVLVIYALAGAAGSAASYAFGDCLSVSLGASGAVLGTLGAVLADSLRRRAEEPAAPARA